jgi:hypothetical protein
VVSAPEKRRGGLATAPLAGITGQCPSPPLRSRENAESY